MLTSQYHTLQDTLSWSLSRWWLVRVLLGAQRALAVPCHIIIPDRCTSCRKNPEKSSWKMCLTKISRCFMSETHDFWMLEVTKISHSKGLKSMLGQYWGNTLYYSVRSLTFTFCLHMFGDIYIRVPCEKPSFKPWACSSWDFPLWILFQVVILF